MPFILRNRKSALSFANFSAAMAALEPSHWWRMSEPIGGVAGAGKVLDYGNSADPQNMYSRASTYLRQGHDDPAEFSYKMEDGQYIRIQNTQVGETFPNDILTQSQGAISFLVKLDNNWTDGAPDPWRSVFQFDAAANVDARDAHTVSFTTWPAAQDVGYEQEAPSSNFEFTMNKTATTNFWKATLENENFFDGKWHYFVIQSDGTNISFWIDGEDRTGDMTITTGGTGVDETTWWASYTNWDTIGVNYAVNGANLGMEVQMAHLCLFNAPIPGTSISAAYASLPVGGLNGVKQQPSPAPYFWRPRIDLADPYHAAMVESHPYVWLRMDEPSGDLVKDYGHWSQQHALIHDSPRVTLDQAGPGAALEKSIRFAHDATNKFAGLSADMWSGSQSLLDDIGAFMVWIYIEEPSLPLGTNCPIIHQTPQITSWNQLNVWISTDGRFNFWLEDPGSSTQSTHIISTNPLTLNAWHCLIVDQSNNNWRMWIDGVEDTTYTYGTASTSELYWWDELAFPNPWSTIGFQMQAKNDYLAPVAGNVYDGQETFRLSNLALWLGETNNQGADPLSASRLRRAPINPTLLNTLGRGLAA
jgi:hypothetical protein